MRVRVRLDLNFVERLCVEQKVMVRVRVSVRVSVRVRGLYFDG